MTQFSLFEADAPAPHYNAYARLGALMVCPVIEAELMAIFQARPAEWLDWPAFRPVIEKHGCGFGLGHKLGSMARRGLLEEKNVYLGRGDGADRPGSPNYQGFKVEYRFLTTLNLEAPDAAA